MLIKDYVDISDMKFTNIIVGNFSKLEFTLKNERYLLNHIYSSNDDKEVKVFYEVVFQDDDYNNYKHILYAGDFNVPLNHDLNTSRYLHINNNKLRRYIKS